MPAPIKRYIIAGTIMVLTSLAYAQAPRWPTQQDIDRAIEGHPFPGADRLGTQPVPQPPRIDPKAGGIDIEALVRGRAQIPGAATAGTANTSALRIFITLDMPRASLQLLTEQASRAGAVLVLRGLKSQSMRVTLAVVSDLIGKRGVAWVIDPEAFTRFGVNKAPTFVLALKDGDDPLEGCSGGCMTPAAFVSVAGDVSLAYALETMQRRRPEAGPRAQPLLKRLRGS